VVSGCRCVTLQLAASEFPSGPEGAWRAAIFNCTDASPRKMRITKAIGEVQKAIFRSGRGMLTGGAAGTHRMARADQLRTLR